MNDDSFYGLLVRAEIL